MGIWVHPYAVIRLQVVVIFRENGVWPRCVPSLPMICLKITNNLRKCPKHYRTAPSPMTDIGHYLAKNHATKNVIEPKWALGARAQYGQTAWLCAMV